MTEAYFVKKNLQRWEDIENSLRKSKAMNPDVLARYYTELTDDLAYANTHFPNTDINQYLQALVAQLHQRIHLNKKVPLQKFAHFWKYEIPAISYKYRKTLRHSLLIFLLSIGIGALSAANDQNFLRLILGDSYVNMTEANIEKGDPMAVYKQDSTGMFASITFNNIRVSFTAFMLGLFFSLGTVYIMLTNGIMLGSFQFFFYQKGLFLTSFLTVWIHGTLEISAIVIAGGAGLIMGNSLLFPGTHPRLKSLQKGAKEGAKLVAGLVPIFIMAGFLEGYVTKLTEMPSVIKILIISTSALFVLFYFVYYPKLLHKHGKLPIDTAV